MSDTEKTEKEREHDFLENIMEHVSGKNRFILSKIKIRRRNGYAREKIQVAY